MIHRRLAALALSVAVAVTTAACGTISRPEDGVVRTGAAPIIPTLDPRISASDRPKLEALARELAAQLQASPSPSILALSGGGANGAYGAGVLAGWTESGRRPSFAIVTGVSTGALAAPFAFLGSEWDDDLRAAYTDGGTSGLLSWRSLAAFLAPSVFSPRDLERLVEEHVTPQLLSAIAREHANGRRLYVATTDLDAQETVIWDMGVLASQGPQGLELFRTVLIASASIPGVFPPVMIAGLDEQGRVIQSMHVDGGVNTAFLGIPTAVMDVQLPAPTQAGAAFYVLVNGQVVRARQVTPGRLKDILARSYDSMSKASLQSQLVATAEFSHRTGLPLYVAAIPGEVSASSLDFSQEAMTALFELGRRQALGGDAWTSFSIDQLSEMAETASGTPGLEPTPVPVR